jgi:pantothenate synthetase
MLKKGLFALIALVCLNFTNVQAQDEEIKDKDLYNYALLMQVVDQMKAEVNIAATEMISNQNGFDVKRYMELRDGGNDAAKLTELGANEFEVKFMTMIVKEQDDRKESIKEALTILASKMVGVKEYKAVKSALASDTELKAKYDEIVARIAPPEEEV